MKTVLAPLPTRGKTNVINSVFVAANERVEWHWQHDPDGSYIIGYTIHSS